MFFKESGSTFKVQIFYRGWAILPSAMGCNWMDPGIGLWTEGAIAKRLVNIKAIAS